MAFATTSITRLETDALMPEEATDVINGVEQGSVVMPMMTDAGRMSRLQERVPCLDVLPQAFFVNGDDGFRQSTTLQWKNKFIVPQEICAIAVIPQTVLDDSGYPIWAMAIPKIRQAISQQFDIWALTNQVGPAPGSALPSSFLAQAIIAGNGRSLSGANFTQGQTYGGTPYNGATYTNPGSLTLSGGVAGPALYQALAGDGGCYQAVELQGYVNNGMVCSPAMKGKLRGMVDADGRPLLLNLNSVGTVQAGPKFGIAGVDATFAENNSLPLTQAYAIGGDFKQAMYAIREDVNFRPVKDGVITDQNNNIIYNLTQQRMAAILVWFRAGFQTPNIPNLLASANTVDIYGNNTTRSPFFALVA